MRDAHYLRSQAELCLRIAQLMSDSRLAECFRAAATEYFLHALDLEDRSVSAQPNPSAAAQR